MDLAAKVFSDFIIVIPHGENAMIANFVTSPWVCVGSYIVNITLPPHSTFAENGC